MADNQGLYTKEINFNIPENKQLLVLNKKELFHIKRHISNPGYTAFIESVDRQMETDYPCSTCLLIASKLGHI